MDEEVEAHHLKFLQQPPAKFFEAVARFNANISYSGLLHAVTQDTLFAENKEKLIVQGLNALLANECKSQRNVFFIVQELKVLLAKYCNLTLIIYVSGSNGYSMCLLLCLYILLLAG